MGDPITSQLRRIQLLEVFGIYSWSYDFLSIGKIMKTAGSFHSETGLWTDTLNIRGLCHFLVKKGMDYF